jgi:hypothetical protein
MADPRINFESVLQTAIDSSLKELHTTMPAIIKNFYPDTQLIDAQPTIKRKLDGVLVDLPLLVDVPIRFFRSKNFSMTCPVEIGDHVLILFAERSIDNWLLTGEIKSPENIRKHSLSDAFAIPFMYPQTELITDFDPINFTIKCDAGFLKLTPAGDIFLNGNTDNAVAYTDLKTAFDNLKSELNAFITKYNTATYTISGVGTTGKTSAPATPATADMTGAKVNNVKLP